MVIKSRDRRENVYFLEIKYVLVQIDVLLKSRPLCSMNEDQSEPCTPTPAHFLMFTSLQSLICLMCLLTRFQMMDQLLHMVWERSCADYLLEVRAKRDIDEASMVVIQSTATPALGVWRNLP